MLDIGKVCSGLPGCRVLPEESAAAVQNDLDLGASGAIIMADKQLVITGGKQGPIYLAKVNNLGGYDPAANNTNAFEVTSSLSTSAAAHDVASVRGVVDEGAPTPQMLLRSPPSFGIAAAAHCVTDQGVLDVDHLTATQSQSGVKACCPRRPLWDPTVAAYMGGHLGSFR